MIDEPAAAWRRLHSSLFRGGSWYFLGAALLTAAWLAAAGLAPDVGLTRSYWYPIDAPTEPMIDEQVTNFDLTFIEEQGRPTQNYRVRWKGVWFSPQSELIRFHAGADDGVILTVDGETILERSPAVGMHSIARTLKLAPGPHLLEVDHWQHGGGWSLDLRLTPASGSPGASSSALLFAEDPGAVGYWLRVAAMRMPVFVFLVWAAGIVSLMGRIVFRRITDLSPDERWPRLRTVMFPAILGPSQVLLFGPWTVHNTNRTEFLVGFWELAPIWVWLLVPIIGALTALGLILPARWFPRYVAGLCAVGVLTWAQGNLLLADYGLLGGSGLDLASHAWRIPLEAGLWASVLLLAVVFANGVAGLAPVASGVLVALQAIVPLIPVTSEAALTETARSPDDNTQTGWSLPPQEIYELSSTRNIIHIVLDQFPTSTFVDILDADRPAFEPDWSGFTLFANHLGAHRHTVASMPAMLSGVAYRNEIPFPEFRARHPSVFNILGQEGYRLRSVSALGRHPHLNPAFPGIDAAVRYNIPTPYGSYRDYVDTAAAQLLDLSLFRHAPHALKPSVYRDQQWFFQRQIALARGPGATAEEAYGNAVFLHEFANRITRRDAAPVYTFLHLITPHDPIVTNADCSYAPKPTPNPGDFADQARCALSGVQMLLRRLRDLDLYDHSAIIVTSDHGATAALSPPEDEQALRRMLSPAGTDYATFQPRATPLLLVKPFAAGGPLQISHAPTSIVDVPATMLDLAGLPDTLGGTSVLGLDPSTPRQRTYAHAGQIAPRPFFDVLYVFAVNGRVTDGGAWSYYRSVFGPADDRVAQRREHRIGLSADQARTGNRPSPGVYQTANYAVFYSAPENSQVTFDVRRMPAATAQTVTVRIDGHVVGEHLLADDAWRTLSYPVEPRSANTPFCIELLTSSVWRDTDGDSYGVMIRGDI